MIASGRHLQSDTYTTFGVALSLIFVYFTKIYWIDAIVALGFGGYIIFIGVKIIRTSLKGIMDEADEKILNQIALMLSQHRLPQWVDIHNMKVQQFGEHLHIDAHITLPWYYSLKDAHNQMESVMALLEQNIDRSIEFNFHMDDCKSFSCELCELNCSYRQKPFLRKINWDKNTISQPEKHILKN